MNSRILLLFLMCAVSMRVAAAPICAELFRPFFKLGELDSSLLIGVEKSAATKAALTEILSVDRASWRQRKANDKISPLMPINFDDLMTFDVFGRAEINPEFELIYSIATTSVQVSPHTLSFMAEVIAESRLAHEAGFASAGISKAIADQWLQASAFFSNSSNKRTLTPGAAIAGLNIVRRREIAPSAAMSAWMRIAERIGQEGLRAKLRADLETAFSYLNHQPLDPFPFTTRFAEAQEQSYAMLAGRTAALANYLTSGWTKVAGDDGAISSHFDLGIDWLYLHGYNEQASFEAIRYIDFLRAEVPLAPR